MKGWYGNSHKHALASRGIKSVENMQEDVCDYDYRRLGTSFWKEFVIDDVNTMEEAIELVLDYEYKARMDKLKEDEMRVVNDRINSYHRMSKEEKIELLNDYELSEEELLDEIRNSFKNEKKAIYNVIYETPTDKLISDNSYEDENTRTFYIDLHTDYINSRVNRLIKAWRK